MLEAWDCLVCENTWARGFKVLSIIANASRDTYGYVGVSATNKIVVAFQGSSNIGQWITDLTFVQTQFIFPGAPAGAMVHEGFYHAFLSVQTQVMAAVSSAIAQYPDYDIYSTGHSLGAALAAFASLFIQQAYPSRVVNHLTFGQPRTGNQVFATFFDDFIHSNKTWRVTHYKDIVPHLPPEDFSFYHIENEAYQANVFTDSMSCMTLCYDGEDPNCADRWDVADSISDHLHYLGQPQGCNACYQGCDPL